METNDEPLKKTPFYDVHIAEGAKMAPFAGFSMPIQYSEGLIAEHQQVRNQAGLFDVSHMVYVRITGEKAIDFIETCCPVALSKAVAGQYLYTQILNITGGIIDDCLVARDPQDPATVMAVLNAGNADKDLDHLNALAQEYLNIKIESFRNWTILALQGPLAAQVFETIIPDLSQLRFMTCKWFRYKDTDILVSRTGYTGEDGFEITSPAATGQALLTELLKDGRCKLCGLGARDTLRLEAGLCLHGNDITEDISPIEAGLNFSIPKSRRDGIGYLGAKVIGHQITEGISRKLVGILPEGRAIARHDMRITNQTGEDIGYVTSGSFSPSLERPIGMALIDSQYIHTGQTVMISIRNKSVPAEVVKLPFVPHRYYRG